MEGNCGQDISVSAVGAERNFVVSYQQCMPRGHEANLGVLWPGLRLVTSRTLSGLSDTCLTINVVVVAAAVVAVAGCCRCRRRHNDDYYSVLDGRNMFIIISLQILHICFLHVGVILIFLEDCACVHGVARLEVCLFRQCSFCHIHREYCRFTVELSPA
jgi:hypothetical protein